MYARILGMILASFNTDDGIRRATIMKKFVIEVIVALVSIPMTVLGGLQSSASVARPMNFLVSIPMTVLGGLQCPDPSFEGNMYLVSIPMTVLGGLQLVSGFPTGITIIVSIPMTVLGGLQCYYVFRRIPDGIRFNTDDGIRRATISQGPVNCLS